MSMFSNIRPLGFLLLLAALPGCQVQSGVQGRYVETQAECRSTAESQMGSASSGDTVSAKRRNAQLVDYFSTCMIRNGWHVARPVKNPVVPTPPGTTKNPQEAALPAQPLPGQPSSVVTAATPAKPAAAVATPSSPPNQPVRTEPSLLQPSGGQPALSTPATGQAPAAYQRTVPVQQGTGTPGRNFQ